MSFDKRVKVVTLGDAGVGKTSIVSRMRETDPKPESYLEPGSTIGVDFTLVQLFVEDSAEPTMFRVELWDTAGQERYSAIVNSYLRNGDIFLIVFDCTNMVSFEKVQSWLDKSRIVHPESPVIILGNKADLIQDESLFSKTYGSTDIEILYVSAVTTYHLAEFKQLLTRTCAKSHANAKARYNCAQSIRLTDDDDLPDAHRSLLSQCSC